MDSERLQRLRERYRDAPGDRFFDPGFVRAGAEIAATHEAHRTNPYTGVATLLDLPCAAKLDNLDVALIGVPMDLGVTNRAGARLGPRAVRAVERIGPYHHVHRIVPRALVRAADVGDVPLESRFSLHQCHANIETFFNDVP